MAGGSEHDDRTLLGVGPGASSDDIRRAYRRQARRLHPDAGGDPAAFQRLGRARDALLASFGRDSADVPGAEATDGLGPDMGTTSGAASGVAPLVAKQWQRVDPIWGVGTTGGRVVGFVSGQVMLGVPPDAAPFGHHDDAVVARTLASGMQRWRAGMPGPVVGGVSNPGGELLAVATTDGTIHGLDAATGVTRWECRVPGPVTAAVALDGEGTPKGLAVVVGDAVRFVGPDGAIRWARRLDRPAATMVRSGSMLVVLDGARVVVLDGATGRPRWWMRHGGGNLVPPVGLDGWLWLAGSQGRLEAVDLATGAACRRVDMGDEVVGLCPTIAGLVVRTAASGLVMLGPRGTPKFRIHLTAAHSDPVALSDPIGGTAGGEAPLPPVGAPLPPTRVLAIALEDGSVRFVGARTGGELHHVLFEGQPVVPPFSLHMVGGNTVVLAGVGGGLGVHRRIGVDDGT